MFENKQALAKSATHDIALRCLAAGIEAAHPKRITEDAIAFEDGVLSVNGTKYIFEDYDNILIVGGGNAASHAATALEKELDEWVTGGIVVSDDLTAANRIETYEADHPYPTERGVQATETILNCVSNADERTFVIAAITGGGSALLTAPSDDVPLNDIQSLTEQLLNSGADIHEMNTIRKHISKIKGGQLASEGTPARICTLIISDVIGDDIGTIASGPTAPDESTYQNAREVLWRYDIETPQSIETRLLRGANGELPETPSVGSQCFKSVDHHIIGNASTALNAAKNEAVQAGYNTVILSQRIHGEAREAGLFHVSVAEECVRADGICDPPAVILSGGETTVTIQGDGIGGPNQEFALKAALEMQHPDIVAASVDSDGYDGPTDIAGAIVDSETITDRSTALEALSNNDASAILSNGELIQTGATGTNVNDIRVVVIDENSS